MENTGKIFFQRWPLLCKLHMCAALTLIDFLVRWKLVWAGQIGLQRWQLWLRWSASFKQLGRSSKTHTLNFVILLIIGTFVLFFSDIHCRSKGLLLSRYLHAWPRNFCLFFWFLFRWQQENASTGLRNFHWHDLPLLQHLRLLRYKVCSRFIYYSKVRWLCRSSNSSPCFPSPWPTNGTSHPQSCIWFVVQPPKQFQS